MEEVKRICPNPKVYQGIKWLSTYISIRPGEMLSLKEGNIDRANGYLYFPHPKEKKSKAVPILSEDVELLKTFVPSFPAMPFFRHIGALVVLPKMRPLAKNTFISGGSRLVTISA